MDPFLSEYYGTNQDAWGMEKSAEAELTFLVKQAYHMGFDLDSMPDHQVIDLLEKIATTKDGPSNLKPGKVGDIDAILKRTEIPINPDEYGAKAGGPRKKIYTGWSKKIREFGKSRGLRIAGGIGAGLATAGGIGAGIAALSDRKKGKRKKASAFYKLAEDRALDMLYEAGYIDQYGNVYAPEHEKVASDFDTEVEVAALQMLEEQGWPVQWNQ